MQQYKVLGAMLALGEFTVPQLVEASGVSETSVRTVVRRHEPWIKKLTKAEPGRRGGQMYVYSLVPEACTRIREKLKELYPLIVAGQAGTDLRPPVPAEADGDKCFALVAVQRDWAKLRAASSLEEVRGGYRRLCQNLANAAADLRIGSHHAPTADSTSSGPQRRYEHYRRLANLVEEKITSATATPGETSSASTAGLIAEVRETAACALESTPAQTSYNDSQEALDLNGGGRRGDLDLAPLAAYDDATFERWLRVGLERYFIEDKGDAAFRPLATPFIGHPDQVARGLQSVYGGLPAHAQAAMRQATANLFVQLEPTARNAAIFKALLRLASDIRAYELLLVIPTWITRGSLNVAQELGATDVCGVVLTTVAALAAPTPPALTCLHALIADPSFNPIFAGDALIALCHVDSGRLPEHMTMLRQKIGAMFRELDAGYETGRVLAKRVLGAVGFAGIVRSIVYLKYIDVTTEAADLDHWLLDGLLKGGDAPLRCNERDGELFFFLWNERDPLKRDLETQLTWEEGRGDVISWANSYADLYIFIKYNGLMCDDNIVPPVPTAEDWEYAASQGLFKDSKEAQVLQTEIEMKLEIV